MQQFGYADEICIETKHKKSELESELARQQTLLIHIFPAKQFPAPPILYILSTKLQLLNH